MFHNKNQTARFRLPDQKVRDRGKAASQLAYRDSYIKLTPNTLVFLLFHFINTIKPPIAPLFSHSFLEFQINLSIKQSLYQKIKSNLALKLS